MALKGLIGMAAGGALGYGLAPEDEKEEVAAAFSGILGAGSYLPKYLMSESGRGMSNFQEGAYNLEDLKLKNIADKIAARFGGNMGVSTKRNILKFARGENLTDLQKTFDDLYGTGGKRAGRELRAYQKKRSNYNVTPEELRLKELYQRDKMTNAILDRKIARLEKIPIAKPSGYGLSPDQQMILRELKELKSQKRRVGMSGRMYRHEIAKNEVQAMTWGKKFSPGRLKRGGYQYEGMYRWGDVKSFMNNSASAAWEKDANSWIRQLGINRNVMLNDNKAIHVIRNIHRGDRAIPLKLGKKYVQLGERVSYMLGNGHIKNMAGLKDYLRYALKQHPQFYALSKRELSEGKTIESIVSRMANEVKNSGGFVKKKVYGGGGLKLRGNFRLSNLGGVSTLYLEGGINTTAEFKPMMVGKNNRLYIAERILKSDMQDLPGSVQSGIQKNPPLVVDEYIRRIDPTEADRTKRIKYGKLKSGTPFDDDALTGLRNKQLNRTEVMQDWRRGGPIVEKVKKAASQIKKIPTKRTLRYAARRLPGAAKVAATAGLGGYALYETLKGKKN